MAVVHSLTSVRICLFATLLAAAITLTGCQSSRPASGGPSSARGVVVKNAVLPADYHGRLVRRTMRPRYITVHATQNRGGTAANHSSLLRGKGIRSKNNPRFGRSGWVVWHYTVDDREAIQHLLPTEQGDHADYGGRGDTASIGVEICEFSSRRQQAESIDNAARLVATLAERYNIPKANIVPHMHWPRWDFAHGKPCPRILLERDRRAPGGWRLGTKWNAFLDRVEGYR